MNQITSSENLLSIRKKNKSPQYGPDVLFGVPFVFRSINLLIAFMAFTVVWSQDVEKEIYPQIEGHWQGAFIKNNSYQKFDVQFYKDENKINSLQIIEEWHPQFGEFVLPVAIDSVKTISFNTGYGKANLQLDERALEMVGTIEGSLPATYVHLKKIPDPPLADYKVEEVRIPNGSIELYGHLHEPINGPFETAMILVGGRGCYAGSTKYDLYAKLLRAYGVSVIAFNKRGTGSSTGDCSKATIGDLASDVVAIKKFLEQHSRSFKNIGVLGSSAGGWVMVKAEETTNFDFMISVVGPSTSVKDQQLQSMDYGFEFYKLAAGSKAELMEYTHMMFDAKATEANFKRFQELLTSSEQNGWKELLDDTDIPANTNGINDLWVRKHDYDPGRTLSKFSNPFLAIYGEIDWIVPYKENVARLNELFTGDRKTLLHTVVAPYAEHGTETKGVYTTLTNDRSYWRFFRISPSVQIELINFLQQYNFITTK